MAYGYTTKRERKNTLIRALKDLRIPYEAQAREVADNLLPYRLRVNLSDQNRGDRRNSTIYDSTATLAVSTLEAGFTAGMTSPAKRWLRWSTKDPELYEYPSAREWLDFGTSTMLSILGESNFYSSIPTFWGDMAGFATSAMSLEERVSPLIHTRTFPFGSYWIAQDGDSNVNVFYREFKMTVRQLYETFGEKAQFSQEVKNLVDRSMWEEWIEVGHLIEPNMEYEEGMGFSPKGKPFSSCWFEVGSSSSTGTSGYAAKVEKEDIYLREGGFDSFPMMVGRWKNVEGDVWGIDCPAMTALGDIKSLQIGSKRSWQAIEKMVNPHMVGPVELQGQDHGFIPGEITWLDERDGMKGLRPIYEINPRIQELEGKLAEGRERIWDAFHTPLFRTLALLDERDRTALEIEERKQEGRTELLPRIEEASRNLTKYLGRLFQIIIKREMMPPAPPELQGQDVEFQYLGVLAQAQKAVDVQPIERFAASIASMAAVDPSVADKFDTDNAADVLGDALGIPSKILRGDEEVAVIRENRAKQRQQEMALNVVKEGSVAAKNLASAKTDQRSALTDLMGAAG